MRAHETSPATFADGLVELPPRKIAAVATYLELRSRPAGPAPGLEPLRCCGIGDDLPRYRALYAAVGEPWLWFSRAVMSDARLGPIVSDRNVEALAFEEDGRDVGMVELDFRRRGECELAFFGLIPAATGRGFARRLMAEALRRAFARPIRRVWLHTCTLDHPAAMPFYLKTGFTAYRRAIEVADDPRCTGHMPRGAAPHYPIV